MKKLYIILTILTICFSFTGCTKGQKEQIKTQTQMEKEQEDAYLDKLNEIWGSSDEKLPEMLTYTNNGEVN